MSSQTPRIAILSTGTEILQGMYPDTNAQFLAAQLTALGYETVAIAAARDDENEIIAAIQSLFGRAEMIISTGGLGPTFDDAFRGAAARLWERPLRSDKRAWEMIQERFAGRPGGIPESNRVQTMIPDGGAPLYNYCGTAPGFILDRSPGRPALAALPGPPREMQPMFLEQVAPYLKKAFPASVRQAILEIRTAGVSESSLNESVSDLVGARPDVDVALLAGDGMARVRLTLRGKDEADLDRLRSEMAGEIVRRVGPENIWGFGGGTLQEALAGLLIEMGLSIVVAESCTGGMINAALTDVPGSSAFLKRGYVVYSNEAKADLLGVNAETLAAHGAVSSETAAEMAEGALRVARADIAVSVTGIAGPSGGSEEKPVGLVWFGIATRDGTETRRFQFPGSRPMVRRYAVTRALDLVRRRLLKMKPVQRGGAV
jgi:nicotinamide-nucleotide amidase